MLTRLSIKNYALIDDLSLDFTSGLTIITGETGAGKSIMLDALSLLLGARADTKAIADESTKSVVEAKFSNIDPALKELFENSQLDWIPEETIVRREITSYGRSRAFVNDSPVNLTILAEITSRLVDIHSQHSSVALSKVSSQLKIIDSFAGNSDLLGQYRGVYEEYRVLHSKIMRRKEEIESSRKNHAIMAYQLEQLDKLNPKRGELETIEKEFDILSDADEIRSRLQEASCLVEGNEVSLMQTLGRMIDILRNVDFSLFSTSDTLDISIPDRLAEVAVEVKDISETLRGYLERVESDPGRLAKISARMQQLYEAEKYFKISQTDGLVELRESLRNQLSALDSGDSDLAEMENEARRLARRLKALGSELTEVRRKASEVFSESLVKSAMPLGLPNLRFEVSITPGKLGRDGQDKIEFLCSFNKNQEPQPLGAVASGGEMSRLMLSAKNVMASKMSLPTVVFDEIDTGVSGEIADRMGEMMADMSESMQVLTITHLPQVAAKGKSHFKVYKTDSESRTVTHVRSLDKNERVEEIAGMLSGSTLTQQALKAAKALMG